MCMCMCMLTCHSRCEVVLNECFLGGAPAAVAAATLVATVAGASAAAAAAASATASAAAAATTTAVGGAACLLYNGINHYDVFTPAIGPSLRRVGLFAAAGAEYVRRSHQLQYITRYVLILRPRYSRDVIRATLGKCVTDGKVDFVLRLGLAQLLQGTKPRQRVFTRRNQPEC